MSVRRVSDLPDLSSYYPNAQLSDCLMEVSYASPNTGVRRYQSFYQNLQELSSKLDFASHAEAENISNYISTMIIPKLGDYLPLSILLSSGVGSDMSSLINSVPDSKTIINYIENLGHITIKQLSGLHIGDIFDLTNRLQSLLNSDNMVFFVAQDGIKYDDLFITQGDKTVINYNIQMIDMQLSNSSSHAPYKTVTWKTSTNIRNRQWYANDIIFFKTINDALKMSTQFKFLNNSNLYIRVCTNLIWPLKITYTEDSAYAYVSKCTTKGINFTHSDNCKILISGTKIEKVDIQMSNDSITQYTVTYSDILRLIFFDKISYCNSRFVTCISINNASFYNLMFDHGHVRPKSALRSITFDNYTINQWNNPTETHFYSCAFLFGDTGIVGSNINTHAVSFSNCLNGIVIYGGGRSAIDNIVEMLSCRGTAIAAHELGSVIRNVGSRGYMYIHYMENIKNYVGASWSGSVSQMMWHDTTTPNIENSAFTSADINGNVTILPQNTPAVISDANVCVNPSMNSLILLSGDYSKIEYSGANADSRITSFCNALNGNDNNLPSNHNDTGMWGYTRDGFLRYVMNDTQQYVNQHTNVYDNYYYARGYPDANFHRILSATYPDGAAAMDMIWMNPLYMSYYAREHFHNEMSNYSIPVNVNGTSDQSHQMLTNILSVDSMDYSLCACAQVDSGKWKVQSIVFGGFMQETSSLYDYSFQRA